MESVKSIDLVVNISASPFYVGKLAVRQEILSRCATRLKCGVAYCNLVGGQDELVFDGRSMFVDSAGRVVAQAKAFAEDMLVAQIARKDGKVIITDNHAVAPYLSPVAEVYEALALGTRDYVQKNKFKKVVIGLSGGIDSALTAAIAVAALGKENVVGVTMPSRFNSNETISDAGLVAKNLGMEFRSIPIGGILETFDITLNASQGWDNKGLAYENLQARIRGTILMSLSNQLGWLVLTTGNKSETAVGYSTLYGDTAGGFAVIKDVPKTLVYQLADYINKISGREVIPVSTIKRIPTAELRPDQKDSDSLPEYDLLDTILKGYVEEDKSSRELAAQGLPDAIVGKIIRMIDRNEYKRRQSPPGIKITPKAFGKDWRLPITNAYGSQTR
jgi:NAD+ synthase (glutamine-hydrolysing)